MHPNMRKIKNEMSKNYTGEDAHTPDSNSIQDFRYRGDVETSAGNGQKSRSFDKICHISLKNLSKEEVEESTAKEDIHFLDQVSKILMPILYGCFLLVYFVTVDTI